MDYANTLSLIALIALVMIGNVPTVNGTPCGISLQQSNPTYTVLENSPTIYIPYSCTFHTTTNQKSYLSTDAYNQNFQKLQSTSVGNGQTLPDGSITEPFAVTLKNGATLDYECHDCATFTVTLNCQDHSCGIATVNVDFTVINELEKPRLLLPIKLLLVAPELSGKSDSPISSIGSLNCVSNLEYSASPCNDMLYKCRSGYSSSWGAENCGGGIRAFKLNHGDKKSYKVELQHPSKLSLRASIRNKKFGSPARSWHLIYSYNMDNRNSDIIPTIKWDLLAGKAQFQDKKNDNKYVILIKRLCPSCRATHKEIIYRRIAKQTNREFNSLWWKYFQLSNGAEDDNNRIGVGFSNISNVLNTDFELYSTFSDVSMPT